jgi:hypothetical protein
MFQGLGKWLRRRAIRRRQKSIIRNKRFHSFDTAKSIGIVFKMEGNELPAELQATMKFLSKKRINFFAIGYYDHKEMHHSFINTAHVSVFSKMDLNWYGKPRAVEVETFLHQGYDIVIDFCREDNVYPIQYITSAVQASMVIGGVYYPRCPYDLIIDAQKVCNTAGYVEQIKHYLSIINNPQSIDINEE